MSIKYVCHHKQTKKMLLLLFIIDLLNRLLNRLLNNLLNFSMHSSMFFVFVCVDKSIKYDR